MTNSANKRTSQDALISLKSDRAIVDDNDSVITEKKKDGTVKRFVESQSDSSEDESDRQLKNIKEEDSAMNGDSSLYSEMSSSSAHSYFRETQMEPPIISVSRLDDMQPFKNSGEKPPRSITEVPTPRSNPEVRNQVKKEDEGALGNTLVEDKKQHNIKQLNRKITGFFKEKIWEEFDKNSQRSKRSSSNDSLRSQISMMSKKDMEAKHELFSKISASNIGG